MLESRTYIDSRSGRDPVAVCERPELGVWAMISAGSFSDRALDALVASLENDDALTGSVTKALNALNDLGYEGRCDLLLCRFDSFHYEVCCVGSASACVEGGVGNVDVLSEPATHTHVRRVLGDLHEGESLLLALEGASHSVSESELGRHALDDVQATIALYLPEASAKHSYEEFGGLSRTKKAGAALSSLPFWLALLALLGWAAYFSL